jgi:hypothetical protein
LIPLRYRPHDDDSEEAALHADSTLFNVESGSESDIELPSGDTEEDIILDPTAALSLDVEAEEEMGAGVIKGAELVLDAGDATEARDGMSNATALLLDAEEEERVVDEASWQPGENCGTVLGKGVDLSTLQCQNCGTLLGEFIVLLSNLLLNLRKIPRNLLNACAAALPRKQGFNHGCRSVELGSRLTCLKPDRLYRFFRGMCAKNFTIDEDVEVCADPQDTPARAVGGPMQQSNFDALKRISRAALSTSYKVGTAEDFQMHLLRLKREGVDVGAQAHTSDAYKDCVYLGARAVEYYDAQGMRQPLGSLGVPSSFALIFDTVPLGGVSCFSRHGSPCVIKAITVSPRTGRLYPQLLPTAYPASHNGVDMKQAVRHTISQDPFALTRRRCQSDCSAVGGDGQMVRGGHARANPGTKAAEFIWNDFMPIAGDVTGLENASAGDDDALLSALAATGSSGNGFEPKRPRAATTADAPAMKPEWLKDEEKLHAATVWDPYHREVIIVSRARAAVRDCEELSSMVKLADNFFHFGDGVKILRGASAISGAPMPVGSSWISLTRESVGLPRETKHLKNHFTAYAAGLHAYESWRQAGHHSKTLGSIVDAGKKLTSLQSVSFLLLSDDFLEGTQAPWTLAVQQLMSPWLMEIKHNIHTSAIAKHIKMQHWMREWIRVLFILRQFLSLTDLRQFIMASVFATPSTFFCCFCASTYTGGYARPKRCTTPCIRIKETHFDDSPASIASNRNSLPARGVDSFVFGRFYPGFILSCRRLIAGSKPMFRDVALIAVEKPGTADHLCLAPHCQCSFLASRSQRGPCTCRGVPHRQRPSDECICCLRVPCNRKTLGFYKGRRSFNLPAWVVNTHPSAVLLSASSRNGVEPLRPAPIRFHFRDPKLAAPLGVVMTGRFREKRSHGLALSSACKVPGWLPSAFKSIDAALSSLRVFCETLLTEHRNLWGDEGMNAGMQAVLKYSSVCFNFQVLLFARPDEQARSAFRRLVKLLLPQLRKCTFPKAGKFEHFVRGWPTAKNNFEKGLDALDSLLGEGGLVGG